MDISKVIFRKGRAWAIAARRGSKKKKKILLNSGRFSLEKLGNSVLNFCSRKTVLIAMAQVLSSPIFSLQGKILPCKVKGKK